MLFFDKLTDEQKKYVQKQLFADNPNYSAYYMRKGYDGYLHVGVIDHSNHTTETYYIYKFTDYQLIEICNDKDETVVDYGEIDTINPVVFRYNKAMGKCSVEYQKKALEYYEGKKYIDISDKRREMYVEYKKSLQLAYADINKDVSAKIRVENEIKNM